jgi:cytochrome b561
MAVWTGWLAALLVLLTGSVPLGVRLRQRKRAPPESRPMRTHVVIGLATGAFAFAHTLLVVPALGVPGAVGGGMLALGAGGAAFFVLVAHTGLGFQLRRPKLKDRAEKRRAHSITAALVVAAVAVHVVALVTGAH